jgi:hypothetical protein
LINALGHFNAAFLLGQYLRTALDTAGQGHGQNKKSKSLFEKLLALDKIHLCHHMIG